MNRAIIDEFTALIQQIKAEYLNAQMENNVKEIAMHKYRLAQVKKILGIIKKLNFEITSADQVKDIYGIGAGTLKRISEILETGHLSELDKKYSKAKQSKITGIQELTKIIGVGDQVAKKLVLEHKIRSVADLRKAIETGKIKANNKLLLGLKYFDVVATNIPRSEISVTAKFLQRVATTIDPALKILICGSYRRGKKTSGDIDALMYSNKVTLRKYQSSTFLVDYVDKLTAMGFILDHLTDKNYKTKYMGFCKYNINPVRRIDIRFMPYDSLATAMVYFTGPYELNTIMRNIAKGKGMMLNEYGLYKVDKDGIKTHVATPTEEAVFKKLGLPYLTPVERESYSV